MNAATLQTTPAAHAYLRRATWGLPKERQQEVWDELEEHLLGRAAQLQACGVAPPEALARALAELGSPTRVSAGMTGVYLMPKLILMAAAGALALSATLYALAGGNNSPIVISTLAETFAEPTCVPGAAPPAITVTIVSRSSVDGLTCYVSKAEDAAFSAVKTSSSFVNDQTLIDLAESLGMAAFVNEEGFIVFSRSGKEFMSWRTSGIRHGVRYFPASLAGSLIAASTAATLSGFGPILILTPKAQYSLDIPSPVSFYRNATLGFVELDANRETDFSGVPFYKHQIQTQLPAGEVVLLLTKKSKKYTTDYAPVGKNGVLEIKSNEPRLTFIGDSNGLGGDVQADRMSALLIQVSHIPLNNLKSGIFIPKQATSDARAAQSP